MIGLTADVQEMSSYKCKPSEHQLHQFFVSANSLGKSPFTGVALKVFALKPTRITIARDSRALKKVGTRTISVENCDQ